uniref:Amino acid transporter transmembrane domain-containing protein n=1 Tax=Grammatophora oceanica TaxID=210454 RepID=A0A7S1V378_9STRA|mmetsp:Transcript_35465/g.52795  ORF Transcript_35465/g.52795 Transcript_35465/m.52795 type:complete len:157 (+) Transcript_35465:39-509(+)
MRGTLFQTDKPGNILNNCASADVGATICRLLMGISVVGSFPFCLASCRAAVLDLMGRGGSTAATPRTNRMVSAGLLALVTSFALRLKDAGIVVAINGALMGSALNYIFPAVMLLKSGKTARWERNLNRSLIVIGVVMAMAGGTVSCLNAFAPHLLR